MLTRVFQVPLHPVFSSRSYGRGAAQNVSGVNEAVGSSGDFGQLREDALFEGECLPTFK